MSPDGSLELVVDEVDGDPAIAFKGFEWHTHADLLVPEYGATELEAVRAFVDAILADQLVIAVCGDDGHVRDVRIAANPASEIAGTKAGKVLLRVWGGAEWHAGSQAAKADRLRRPFSDPLERQR